MKTKFIHLKLILLILIPQYSFSTHIVGGEITYTYSGNNNYEIHLTVYRDCANGITPLDNPATFGIFDAGNNLVNSYQVPLDTTITITNSPYNCQTVAPSGICYEEGRYILNVNLPRITGGYQLVYQRCCRTMALINIDNPQSSGVSYYATIPDSIFSQNNSPVFNNSPFTFLCANVPFTFDNSATDADGDSLVYSLFTPLLGGSTSLPMPNPPTNPPYSTVTWLSPYSLSNVMGGTPLTIDPQTGLLSGTPNAIGVFDYGVCVKEFKNGIYIGETKRDFQVYVIAYVGISEITNNKLIKCYPNPFNNSTTFKIEESLFLDNAEVSIYDMIGKEVYQIKNIKSNMFLFTRDNIPDGIYFYKFFNSGKLISMGKITLQE